MNEYVLNNPKPTKKIITKSKVISNIVLYLVLALLSMFFLFPFFVVITRSLMTDAESIKVPVRFFPSVLNFSCFVKALDAEFLTYTKNTLIVVVSNVVFVPLSAALVAFGFARINFRGRNIWFGIILATIMLPSIATQIPVYVMFVKLGWINTLYPLIIPAFLGGGAMNVFLIRQYMRSIPKDLDEAAKIDGASMFRLFFTIIIPIIKPMLLLVAVNTFMGVWNDFMGPLVYLKREENYTLAVGIYYKFLAADFGEILPNMQMAIGVLMVIPPAIIFFIFQRQLMDGISTTGIKS